MARTIRLGEGHSSGDALPEDKPKQFTNLSKADAWWTERLARFLDRLRTTHEGEHDMLRHTTVMYGSGMSWPAYHRNHNLPILLAGGEGVGFAHAAGFGESCRVSTELLA